MATEPTASMLAPVTVGQVLAGKYRVDEVIGIGGMGVVVAATHVALHQRVALKFMLESALANAEATARFLREARAAVRLRSEHVARVLDVGTLENGAPYIVMEYLEGEDLSLYLRRRGSLAVAEAAELVLQACDALAEAHVLGIVHRDMKPANLFLTRRADDSPLVKVLDFGISKSTTLSDPALSLTQSHAVIGSPLYMSPEQMKSSRSVDARSDIWSLGVILHELTTGAVPFDSESLGSLMGQVVGMDPFPRVEQVRPDVGTAFGAIVARCLERDRQLRFANVAEFAIALAPFAPPHVSPLVDRICRVQDMEPYSSSAPIGPIPSGPAGPVGVVAITNRPSVQASRVVSRVLTLAAVAVVAAASIGAWLFVVRGSTRRVSDAVRVAPAAVPPGSARIEVAVPAVVRAEPSRVDMLDASAAPAPSTPVVATPANARGRSRAAKSSPAASAAPAVPPSPTMHAPSVSASPPLALPPPQGELFDRN